LKPALLRLIVERQGGRARRRKAGAGSPRRPEKDASPPARRTAQRWYEQTYLLKAHLLDDMVDASDA
jgi:hypothetical protein